METEGLLPHSQVPATCLHPEPDRSSPCPQHSTAWRSMIILSSHLRLGLPSGLFPSRFLTKFLFSPKRTTCLPPHSCRLDHRTILGEYRSLSSSLCSFLYSVTSSLLGTNILISNLFSNTLSLRSSLNVSDQLSHPYKTTCKIIVRCILIFVFFDSKMEDERFCTEW